MRNILYAQLFFILIIAFVTSTKSYAFNVAKHISNVNGLTNNSVNCIFGRCRTYDLDWDMGWTECI